MSEHSWAPITNADRHPTTYICVDSTQDVATGGVNQNQALLMFVKVGCGTLPCSKFNDGWELACVVCTK